MSKTKETKLIEQKLDLWKPSNLSGFKPSYMRTQIGIHECTVAHGDTKSGIVDYVWIADGFDNEEAKYTCEYKNVSDIYSSIKCKQYSEECIKSNTNELVVDEKCDNCLCKHKVVSREPAHYVICFEIKVTVNDFCSSCGHNFVGDLNYYVLLNSVYDKVIDDVPEDVGVIVASINKDNENVTFKIKKPSKLNKISEETRNWFLQTALSRERKEYTKLSQEYRNACRDYEYSGYRMAYELLMNTLDLQDKPNCFTNRVYSKHCCVNGNDECGDCKFKLENFYRAVDDTLVKFGLKSRQ